MSRLLISAAHKSSGKTTVSIGLAASLAARGSQVQGFKKGPDYIDPLWLERASGRPVFNLDFNTQAPDEMRSLFAARQSRTGINIIEGNKGLHDGVDTGGSDSTAALARLLDSPVVLVVDTSGMTRGIAPLLLGYQAFDPRVSIAGVVLNQVANARQEQKLRAAIETYTDIPVLGALPRAPAVIVKERHLGLTTPGDANGPETRIAAIRDAVEAGIDIDAITAVARNAPRLAPIGLPVMRHDPTAVTIAIARDDAFCFYYPDDLEALERAGARLAFFSPMHDSKLPHADGLVIGGGFPETHLEALEANAPMRHAIRRAIETGMPVHAECGGLMYLSRSISHEGRRGEMVGAIGADAVMKAQPQGRGLVVLESTVPNSNLAVSAHEFHYARLENLDAEPRYAWRVTRGTGIDGAHDGIINNNMVATFSHFRDTSRHHWARDFVAFVRSHARPNPAGQTGATASMR